MSRGCIAWLSVRLLVGAVLGAAPAAAQDDRYFHLRDPFRTERSYVPSFGWSPPVIIDVPTRKAEPLEAPSTDAQGVTYASSQDADAKRVTPALEYIAVFGDSLADPLAQGLADAYAQDMPEVAVLKKGKANSSLIRSDQLVDWVTAAFDMLANEKVTIGVVIVGINERQPVRDETGEHAPGSERWMQIYTRRIDELMARFKAKNVPLYWVGLPAMKSPRLSQDMRDYNEIIRERAARANVPFIDVWDGFVDEAGQFVVAGPALDGQTRRLRGPDGIHFTRAGGRKLAHFVERELQALLNLRIPKAPVVADEPASPGDTPQALPVPQAAARPRPLAGPVVPLIGAGGPSGALAGASPTRTFQSADPVVTRVLLRGDAPPAVPGRADDFAWPSATAPADAPPPAR